MKCRFSFAFFVCVCVCQTKESLSNEKAMKNRDREGIKKDEHHQLHQCLYNNCSKYLTIKRKVIN